MELVTVLLCVLLIVVLYAVHHAIVLWTFFKRVAKVPTAKDCLPVIGHAMQLAVPNRERLDVFQQYIHKNKAPFKIWLGPVPIAILFKPRHIEEILGSTKNINKAPQYTFLEPWLGTGLLTSKGTKWLSHRKMITPTFHFKILDNFVEVFAEKSQILVKKLKKEVGSESVNLYPYVTMCALDIICETAMGTEINAQEMKEQTDYIKAVLEISPEIFHRVLTPWLYPDLLHKVSANGRQLKKRVNILHDFSNKVIKERRKLYKGSKQEINEEDAYLGKKHRLAFLDVLLEASESGNKLTDEEIREEVDTFMFEGHDTTTVGMSWTLQMLGMHPEVQEKAYEELKSIFQGSDRAPSMKDLNDMKYLERVIKESLRLYPSAPMIGRQLSEDVVIDGVTLPAGLNIFLFIYFTHREAEHFPDPEKFNPDNFLPERVANRHPYAYVPFSAGPRNCIGQKFALLEEKMVLSYILRNFKLEAKNTEIPKGLPELVLRPEEGVHLKLTPRV